MRLESGSNVNGPCRHLDAAAEGGGAAALGRRPRRSGGAGRPSARRVAALAIEGPEGPLAEVDFHHQPPTNGDVFEIPGR
jgi:hypothetical protein